VDLTVAVNLQGQDSSTGIYAITHLASGRKYIGSAARSFRIRIGQHIRMLSKGAHHCYHLQRAWNKHGAAAFEISIVEICAPEMCIEREQFHMDGLSEESRFNICPVAGSPRGRKASEETRVKLSRNASLRTFSEETRLKFSTNMKVRWADPSNRENMRTRVAKSHTPESVNQQAIKVRGRKHTAEAIAKIAAASQAISPEKREEMRLATIASGVYQRQAERLRGKKMAEETRLKMSASKKGVPKSPEHRAATSAAIKAWHAKRREQQALAAA
jgi:group I intron endonuclease